MGRSGITELRQAVVFGVKPFFTLMANKHDPRQKYRAKSAPFSPRDQGIMEEFIERTLRERRSLEAALADILTKHARIPSGQERSLLERIISVLTHEIALRKNPRGDRNDAAV